MTWWPGLNSRHNIYQRKGRALFWINLFFSVVLAIILSASAPLLAWIYNEPRIPSLVIVMAALIPIGTLGMNSSALLIRQYKSYRLLSWMKSWFGLESLQ